MNNLKTVVYIKQAMDTDLGSTNFYHEVVSARKRVVMAKSGWGIRDPGRDGVGWSYASRERGECEGGENGKWVSSDIESDEEYLAAVAHNQYKKNFGAWSLVT